MNALYDKTGREIMVGDVLKVYHFQGRRWRKHYYMYKQVIRETTIGTANPIPVFWVSHLNMKAEDERDSGYYEYRDGRTLLNVEIVQGYATGVCHHDRPRFAVPA